jgi:hypothetical protein
MQGIVDLQHAEMIARTMIARLANDSAIEAIDIGVSVSAQFDPAVIGA